MHSLTANMSTGALGGQQQQHHHHQHQSDLDLEVD
jgi:hypothetical protein